MATLISDPELKTILCDPAAFYVAITSWSHYRPQEPAVQGDCELVLSDMVAAGRIVLATLVHSRREAFLSLLSADDASAFRERLGQAVFDMNTATLIDTISRAPRRRICTDLLSTK